MKRFRSFELLSGSLRTLRQLHGEMQGGLARLVE